MELKHPSSLQYLEATPLKVQWELDYHFWPLFMSGHVFQSSLLENMLPFAAMKPELAHFLAKFLKISDFTDPRKISQKSRFATPKTPKTPKSSGLVTPKANLTAPITMKPYFPQRSRNANLATKAT